LKLCANVCLVSLSNDAGYAAGLRAGGDGVAAFLCVNHYISSAIPQTERCQGFADGLGIDLANQMNRVPAKTLPRIKKRACLGLPGRPNPRPDAILTTGPNSADANSGWRWTKNGMAGDIYFGTSKSG